MRGRPLRTPVRPHNRDERGVPKPWCGCETCRQARIDNDPDTQHWRRVGDLLGLDEQDEATKP